MATVPDWFRTRISLTPDKVAIELRSGVQIQNLTWRELAGYIEHAVETLSTIDITEGSRVAVLMGNGLPFVGAVHALMHLRAVLVPLNTRLSPVELAWQLEDAKATLLLTDDDHHPAAQEAVRERTLAPLLNLSPLNALHSPFSLPLTPYSLPLSCIHSILYTSGTTGHPKGVILTYSNHWWSAMGSALNLGVRDDDKWLLVLPMFHVGGLSMLFKNVIYGSTVQIHERFDAIVVNRAIDEEGVTHMSLVATMLQRMLDARDDRAYPPTLRAVLLGGGPCPLPLLERCARLGVPVVQSYGMTETASQSVTLPPGDALRKIGSAGKPLFMAELRIETEGKSATPGGVGEILLRGPNVTPGYADRPEATAQAIRDGWLHTGDLGYLDDDGYLFVVNRRTDLIISGGENIYPAEIEAVLLAHPGVSEAVVVGVSDAEWGQRAAAAVVAVPGSDVTPDGLRAYAEERLAKFKVPREIRIVHELPRNAGGKVLRERVRVDFEELSA